MYEIKYHTEPLENYSFLVTGGAGFIGSGIVEYLIKYGAGKVRVLDDLSSGFARNLKNVEADLRFEFIKGDIRDAETCKQACLGMDFVSHQAAMGSVPRSVKDPIATHSVNADGFLNMLTAAKNAGVKKFIYASSSSVYGDSKTLPKREEEIGNPLSPYAVTKYLNELYAFVFAENYNMKCIGLRYFNIFGPKQSPEGPYAAVIPLFIHALLTGSPPTIHGDGGQTRDFTFVENAVQANIRALFSSEESDNQVYNIAFGQRISVNKLYQLLAGAAASDLKPNHGPTRAGDIRDSLADISKARKLLNYNPEFELGEGLKITFDGFKRNEAFILHDK